jgi:hypothetical protein
MTIDTEKLRAELTRKIDKLIADTRADDRGFLLSKGVTIGEADRMMRAKDAMWAEWRAETIAELFAEFSRSVPDAPSQAVH